MHDDLVGRQFTATAANTVWLTDITEHATGEGKLYMCAIKDVWSNRIVGYSINDENDRSTRNLSVIERGGVTRPGRHDCPLR